MGGEASREYRKYRFEGYLIKPKRKLPKMGYTGRRFGSLRRHQTVQGNIVMTTEAEYLEYGYDETITNVKRFECRTVKPGKKYKSKHARFNVMKTPENSEMANLLWNTNVYSICHHGEENPQEVFMLSVTPKEQKKLDKKTKKNMYYQDKEKPIGKGRQFMILFPGGHSPPEDVLAAAQKASKKRKLPFHSVVGRITAVESLTPEEQAACRAGDELEVCDEYWDDSFSCSSDGRTTNYDSNSDYDDEDDYDEGDFTLDADEGVQSVPGMAGGGEEPDPLQAALNAIPTLNKLRAALDDSAPRSSSGAGGPGRGGGGGGGGGGVQVNVTIEKMIVINSGDVPALTGGVDTQALLGGMFNQQQQQQQQLPPPQQSQYALGWHMVDQGGRVQPVPATPAYQPAPTPQGYGQYGAPPPQHGYHTPQAPPPGPAPYVDLRQSHPPLQRGYDHHANARHSYNY